MTMMAMMTILTMMTIVMIGEMYVNVFLIFEVGFVLCGWDDWNEEV